MNDVNTTHIVLPVINPSHGQAAFFVARVMSQVLDAPLRILSNSIPLMTADEFARQLLVAPNEVEQVTIDGASGDLVDALAQRVDAWRRVMIIFAVRLDDEASPDEEQSTAWRILERISCPILIVPPDVDMTAWRLQRVLLPQDGTPGCAAALGRVINQSTQIGVENLVLRVAGAKISQPTEAGSLATPRYVDHPQYEWESWADEFLDRICKQGGQGADINAGGLRLLMAAGEPVAEILRVADEEGVDMIILPWHRTLGPGRAQMVKAVLRETSVPVLLLPERGGDQGMRSQPFEATEIKPSSVPGGVADGIDGSVRPWPP